MAVKLRRFQRAHVGTVRLVEQRRQLAEHRAGFGDRVAISVSPLTIATAPLLRIKSRPVLVPSANTVSPAS
jgi:hypothetical protein